jgi:prepilin-type N-terminal cleavage/methylation domain-containing protein
LRSTPSPRGFTLVEALLVIALIGIVAIATVPLLRSEAPTKLDAAAVEAGNALRFALSEANRTGGYLLVDASGPGHLRVHASNASGAILGPVKDPLTKAALDIDTSAPPWSAQIAMTARFFHGGTAYTQLLIGPGGQLQVYDGGINRGPLQSGSGVVLASGTLSAMVAIDETIGRVSIPQ